jgi:Methyltransferase domain
VLPHLGDDPIEIGSGLGDQASVWLENGVPRITLSDLEQRSVEALAERFAGDDRVSTRRLDLANCEPGAFSSAVAINVLEHIEDDTSALRATRSLVSVGGKVIVFVPAFPLAMSRFDREIGHHRRYTTRAVTERLVAAGLQPLVVQYVNAPGLIAWILMMRLLRRRPSAGPVVRAWDRRVVPIARRLERRRTAPFGQSVLAVAVRQPDE